MTTPAAAAHPIYNLLPADVDGFHSLADLALDMRWSWNHATDEIWRHLDPVLWDQTHHPCDVLQTVSREKIRRALADPAFRTKLDALVLSRRRAEDKPTWYQQRHADAPPTSIAYFSMEYMLSEALPIYSGGLGNVAADQLKAASDLGVPVVGIGLLYQQGYFRQEIDYRGEQQALFPFNDPGQLPITPLRNRDGDWLRLEITLPGYSMWLRAWQVQVGRVKLYLLDSNDQANSPSLRAITSELYGGGPELRLRQEMVLGIGGWRLLCALGEAPQVCHLNEGHAALAVLERARTAMAETGVPFEQALAVTRAGNLFTTHTAVPAGFDCFPPALVERYLGRYAATLGLSLNDVLALGRRDPDDSTENFNMAYLAMRGSGAINGVSRLHGQVSRHLFEPLFPGWPEDEVPVGHVTNGVHVPTWDSAEADELWTEACGQDRWLGTAELLGDGIRRLSDARLWRFRTTAAESFVRYIRQQVTRQRAVSGAWPETVDDANEVFDPRALTLGFARRFATYKRPDMLLQDPERLLRILTDARHPVQLVLAGKAHPADFEGQALLQRWTQFAQRPAARRHVVFLTDYNMLLAEYLVQGVDVWINTPRRPWEACGTSGMKVLVNGGLNLSELDGWWAEAYAPEVGWALGDGRERGDDPAWDAAEARSLYDLLEQQVIPEFYARGKDGVPAAWTSRMRESMARLTPQFSASRTVRDYTEQHYLPAAAAYRARAADHGAEARHLVEWRNGLIRAWTSLRFGDVRTVTSVDEHRFEVEVHLNDVDPGAVQVELYARASESSAAIRQELTSVRPLPGPSAGAVYSGAVTAARPAADYTARVTPRLSGVVVPLECNRILWQR